MVPASHPTDGRPDAIGPIGPSVRPGMSRRSLARGILRQGHIEKVEWNLRDEVLYAVFVRGSLVCVFSGVVPGRKARHAPHSEIAGGLGCVAWSTQGRLSDRWGGDMGGGSESL
jgi:hypothetical protein